MSARQILYIIITPLIVWVLQSLKIDHLFKKNKKEQIIVLYVLITLSISYLVVNFIMDFYGIIK